ncbi:MAG: type II toxin-antitoxin system HipA family toxin [Polynucleobacter sp.]|nr:type II toxin-antitoxin system HipA family toxin [Polynucleobacter sp.]
MKSDRVRRLHISTPQGHSGELTKEARFTFNYQTTERKAEASLVLPIRAESYSSGGLFSIFQMNKPEGYLLDYLKTRFSKSLYLDDMMLLKLTGANQIGRLQYRDPNELEIPSSKAIVSKEEILSSKASEELFAFLVDRYFDSGISGFQPKVIAPISDRTAVSTSQYIIKAAGDDYPHLAQNEFMCMEVARRAGIRVPEFELSENGELFIMKRFDISAGGERLGLEDMAVLMGKTTDEKYQGSYEGITKAIDTFCKSNATESKARLFEYIALSVLLRNGDAHLKNFSLLYETPEDAITLSPLYDVVTTSIYEIQNPRTGATKVDNTMALNMFKTKRYPSIAQLIEFGKTICMLTHPQDVIERIEEMKLETLKMYSERMDSKLISKLTNAWNIAGGTGYS